MFTPLVVLWFLPTLNSKRRKVLFDRIRKTIRSFPELAPFSNLVHIAAPVDVMRPPRNPVDTTIVVEVWAHHTNDLFKRKGEVAQKITDILMDFFPLLRIDCKVRFDKMEDVGICVGARHEHVMRFMARQSHRLKLKVVRKKSPGKKSGRTRRPKK